MTVSSPSRVLIIMPAWNEAEVIGATIRNVSEVVPYSILVVDDGSKDNTAEVARQAGAAVITLPFNLGVGGAMRTGFKYALRHGFHAVIQVDSDGQHDPLDIDRVLAGLQEADISIGARFAGRGSYNVRGPRKWAMSVLAKVISWVAHVKLTDVTSGFRAANERAMRQYIEHFPTEYLGDTIDSLIVAIKSGCRVVQVPVEMKVRQAGTPSTSPAKSAIYLARSGLVLLFALARGRTRQDPRSTPVAASRIPAESGESAQNSRLGGDQR